MGLGIYIFTIIIALFIGRPIYRYYQRTKLKKHPNQPLLEEIKGEIRVLKQNGKDYNTIISSIKSDYHYPKFMIRGFIIDVENEEKSIVEKPKSTVKSNFRFNYPQNWKIKSLGNDLDIDKYFSIEGSSSGILTFCFFDEFAIEEFPNLQELNKVIGKQYKNYQKKELFSQWGTFIGSGNLFVANHLNLTFSGKIFLYKSSNYGFYLMQGSLDNDYINVSDGFKMIEESFERI